MNYTTPRACGLHVRGGRNAGAFRLIPNVGLGSFSSDPPASDALGMSATHRSRPNLRTAAIRRGVPTADSCSAANDVRKLDDLFNCLVSDGEQRRRHGEAEQPGGLVGDDQLEFS